MRPELASELEKFTSEIPFEPYDAAALATRLSTGARWTLDLFKKAPMPLSGTIARTAQRASIGNTGHSRRVAGPRVSTR
jgi:hypothetical protein